MNEQTPGNLPESTFTEMTGLQVLPERLKRLLERLCEEECVAELRRREGFHQERPCPVVENLPGTGQGARYRTVTPRGVDVRISQPVAVTTTVSDIS